ncbi:MULTISPECIES: hypothetical protein [Burkholderia]|uniref:hypothetical protein n=1 Tax=Burkholderia TaxID=32008 RepID=UPI00126A5003|nr:MULTISPECIES: hypothetical protein [Burkholderia]
MDEPCSIAIRLPDTARYVLMDAASFGIDRIDQVVEKLRLEHPDAFHSKDSLPERGFAHAPRNGTPYRWHVYQVAPQPIDPQRKDPSD